jgi:hypothetical protein
MSTSAALITAYSSDIDNLECASEIRSQEIQVSGNEMSIIASFHSPHKEDRPFTYAIHSDHVVLRFQTA